MKSIRSTKGLHITRVKVLGRSGNANPDLRRSACKASSWMAGRNPSPDDIPAGDEISIQRKDQINYRQSDAYKQKPQPVRTQVARDGMEVIGDFSAGSSLITLTTRTLTLKWDGKRAGGSWKFQSRRQIVRCWHVYKQGSITEHGRTRNLYHYGGLQRVQEGGRLAGKN
jgi:hypothetical protein